MEEGDKALFDQIICECNKGHFVVIKDLELLKTSPKWHIITSSFPKLVCSSIPSYAAKTSELTPLSAIPPPLRNFGNSCFLNVIIQCLFRIDPLRKAYLRCRWSDAVPHVFFPDGVFRLKYFAYGFHDYLSKMFTHMIDLDFSAAFYSDHQILQSYVGSSDQVGRSYEYKEESVLEIFNRIISSIDDHPVHPLIAQAYNCLKFRYLSHFGTQTMYFLPFLISRQFPSGISISTLLSNLREDYFPLENIPLKFSQFGDYFILLFEHQITTDIEHKEIQVTEEVIVQGTSSTTWTFETIAAIYSTQLSSYSWHFIAYIKNCLTQRWYLANDSEIEEHIEFPLSKDEIIKNDKLSLLLLKKKE